VGAGEDAGGGITGADYDARVTGALARGIGSLIVGVAVAIVVLAGSIAPFLNPVWVAFEQDRSHADAWTGYTPAQLRTATDAILSDLVVGPPTFDVVVDGSPVLNERERGHMADVRAVFGAFAMVAIIALLIVIAGWRIARGRAAESYWRGVRAGIGLLVAGVIVVGAIGLLAFDLAFEIFHRLLFAGGTYTFDPRTDRLVQLFPEQFWLETSIAVGIVSLIASAVVWWIGGRRMSRREPASVGVTEPLEARG
jgi:integral membrane protein (TIGR01906 family)